jgi:phosphonoacetate hydrolase
MGTSSNHQRVVIAMIDGFGLDYLDATHMPTLRAWIQQGFYKPVSAVFPSVTNVNNVSICCGVWPAEHGISANSYFDETTGKSAYMNSGDLIRTATLFQRAARFGVPSALLSAKRKTLELFNKDVSLAVTGADPPADFIERYGRPAEIYSAEVNHWLWRVAADLLKTRPDIGLFYVHTTDYPMHRWPPEAPQSQEHLQRLDTLIGEAATAAPDAAFFVTADHGMNFKTRCWDLTRVCAEAGTPIRFMLSPERDYYIKHHRNYSGCAWLWLHRRCDYGRVEDCLRGLSGVEEVLPSEDAALRFHLPRERIGDMVITGARDTMFGDIPCAYTELEPSYRAHGSLHEMEIPLVIYNYGDSFSSSDDFTVNKDLVQFLYR